MKSNDDIADKTLSNRMEGDCTSGTVDAKNGQDMVSVQDKIMSAKDREPASNRIGGKHL